MDGQGGGQQVSAEAADPMASPSALCTEGLGLLLLRAGFQVRRRGGRPGGCALPRRNWSFTFPLFF